MEIKSLMGRLLGQTENILDIKFDEVNVGKPYTFSGNSLLLLRNEILTACNDFKRMVETRGDDHDEKISPALLKAVKTAGLELSPPIFSVLGDRITLLGLQKRLKCGLVYNKGADCIYELAGVTDIVNHLLPFIDSIAFAGLAGPVGYETWKNKVRNLYLGREA
jgi:hypothetical protein